MNVTQGLDPDATPRGRRQDGRITAVVFSRNEAALLPDCLDRLPDFDEILVCDMQSSDDTAAIAAAHGARVVRVPFAPIAESVRQLGLDAAQTQWVLFVDADERLPVGFRAVLQRAIGAVGDDVVALRLRYDNIAFGRPLHHVLARAAKYSLVQADLVDFHGVTAAHSALNHHGPAADAPAFVPPVVHLGYRSVAQVTEKFLRYAQSNPQTTRHAGRPLHLAREVTRAVILDGAWRDGRAGVTVATLSAFSTYYSAALEWEARGYPDLGWPPRTRRLLAGAQGAASSAASVLRRVRARTGALSTESAS